MNTGIVSKPNEQNIYFKVLTKLFKNLLKQRKVRPKNDVMTNERPVHILPLVNYNFYWPIIGTLYCMT